MVLKSSANEDIIKDWFKTLAGGKKDKLMVLIVDKTDEANKIIVNIMYWEGETLSKLVGKMTKSFSDFFALMMEGLDKTKGVIEGDKVLKKLGDLLERDEIVELLNRFYRETGYVIDRGQEIKADIEFYKKMIEWLYKILISSSPYRANLDVALIAREMVEELDSNNTQAQQELMDIMGAMLMEEEFTQLAFGTQGHIAGDVGRASFTGMVRKDSGGGLVMKFPSMIEVFNDSTIGDGSDSTNYNGWNAEGMVINGMFYPADGSDPYKVDYGTYNQMSIAVENEDDAFGGHSWDSESKEEAIRISKPGISKLFATREINLVEYPMVTWMWQVVEINPDYYTPEGEVGYDWSSRSWRQAQMSFKLSDGKTSKWVTFVAIPTVYEVGYENEYVGPCGDQVNRLHPIVYVKQVDGDNDGELNGEDDKNEFKNPIVPESVSLLEKAWELRLKGDRIVVEEIAMAAGIGSTLLLNDMVFTQKEPEEPSGYGQAVSQVLYKVVSAHMGVEGEVYEWLDDNKATYDQMALEVANGFTDCDNLNPWEDANDWYYEAKKTDQYNEFRYFYTQGIVLLRNLDEEGSPIRAVYYKEKEWPQDSETLSAPLYNTDQINPMKKVRIYYDPIYENGWNRELWFNTAIDITNNIKARGGYDVRLADAEELISFMSVNNPEGMVVILGAIPDALWYYKDPLDKVVTPTVLEDMSILKHYLTHGGSVFTAGQYGGGWTIAYLDREEYKVTFGNYDSVDNPMTNDYNVNILDIINYPNSEIPDEERLMDNDMNDNTDLNNRKALTVRKETTRKYRC